jgi:starch-binding outer membrane protein, SusD/RagB family
MTFSLLGRHARSRVLGWSILAGAAGISGCSADEILEVRDPDIIDPTTVSDAAGANALRVGALARFNTSTSGGESFFLWGGLLADEFRSSDTFVQRDETDQRRVQESNANVTVAIRDAQGARVSAMQAAEALVEFAPTRVTDFAEMLFVQGYMENLMAETLCNGIPLSTPTVLGVALTNQEVFERALEHADSAIAMAATDAAGVRIRNAAAVLKGRILLNLNRYADAAAAVAAVPTDFRYLQEQSQSSRTNSIWALNNNARRYTVVDRDGGNGLPFISAQDPRVPVSAAAAGGGFDGTTDLYRQLVYPTDATSFPLMTGIEARLIEAEALLVTDAGAALTKLNNLRAGTHALGAITVSAMPALALGADKAAQVDQLFRERAFWMFASGHRLGDLRRLIRQYSRTEATVFPTGGFFKTGTYGTMVNLPVTQAEENNPNFTGCIDRNA